jgi:hypothetical protein
MQEPATSLNPELMGSIAAIGIVKGKPFAPDARMKKILTESARSDRRLRPERAKVADEA